MTGGSPLDAAVLALGCATLTVGAYRLSLAVRRRWAHPLTTPVLFSTAVVAGCFLATGFDVRAYEPAKALLTFLLGTAQAAMESELAGAVAGVSLGIGAVLTAVAAPLLVTLLAR